MLKFENVSVNIGKTQILKDITAEFQKGKITAIVGPNGCGKTTLLQTLNGLSTVTDGQILLDGEDFLALSPKKRARRLSFMSQFRDSAPAISVKVLVEHGRFPYMGFSRKMNAQDKEAILHALEYTQIEDISDQMVNELSGGLQQRVYLAMQLAQNADYMVMDEPMNYLDFPGQRQMLKLISNLKEQGKTIILVLHDLNQALQIADEVVVLSDRKIVGTKSPKECIESGLLEEVFSCKIKEIECEETKQYLIW